MNQIYRALIQLTPAQKPDLEESKDEGCDHRQFAFNEACLDFATDAVERVRIITASSLHEAFLAAGDDEDTSALRAALHELLADESLSVQTALLPHLDTVIGRYANAHAVASFHPAEQERVELPEREFTF